ncbi:hypothetical protein D3C72_1546420 [compost metagenome]
MHLAADDVAGDDDDDTQQERNAPAPAIELLGGHVVRQRQKNSRRKDLPGLHTLQCEAGEITAPAKRRMLQDHGAGSRDLACHGKSLDQAHHHQQRGRPQANLVIGGQQAHGDG